MQFAVPQFTDIEDKLIGPLTLKQFLLLLATGGVVMFFWSILGLGIIFFLFSLPVALMGVVITFSKFNGRSLLTYVGPMLNFASSAKIMIYRREGAQMSYSQKKKEVVEKKPIVEAVTENRLRKLAYLLDQKTGEEEKLIGEIK